MPAPQVPPRPSPGGRSGRKPRGGWGITLYHGRRETAWSTEAGFERHTGDGTHRWGVLVARRPPVKPVSAAVNYDDDDPVGELESTFLRPRVPGAWDDTPPAAININTSAATGYFTVTGFPGRSTQAAQEVIERERARLKVVPNLTDPVTPEARGAVDMCFGMLNP